MSNLAMKRGDTAIFQTTISNLTSAGLTGATLFFKAKRDVSDADASAVFSKALGAGIAVTQVGNATTPGIINTTVVPADTSALAAYPLALAFDVVMVDAGGAHYTVDSGVLVVSPDVNTAQ